MYRTADRIACNSCFGSLDEIELCKMTSQAAGIGGVQVFHYLKRNPKFTRDQFWAYWEDTHGPKLVPLAEKYGFIQYQQVRVFAFTNAVDIMIGEDKS